VQLAAQLPAGDWCNQMHPSTESGACRLIQQNVSSGVTPEDADDKAGTLAIMMTGVITTPQLLITVDEATSSVRSDELTAALACESPWPVVSRRWSAGACHVSEVSWSTGSATRGSARRAMLLSGGGRPYGSNGPTSFSTSSGNCSGQNSFGLHQLGVPLVLSFRVSAFF